MIENQDTEANSAYNQIRTLDDSNEYISQENMMRIFPVIIRNRDLVSRWALKVWGISNILFC